MARLRVAVVGCGAVSKNHGRALAGNPLAELVYAVDVDRRKAEAFCVEYGGSPLDDYHDLFTGDTVDVVHVVTPHNTHPRIAIECMEHGFDVFCEKPLAMRAYDAGRMIEVSERTGRRLGVCFQNRLNPSTVEAKRIIDSGCYGKIVSGMALVAWDRHGAYYSASPWRGTYEGEGGGCIINQAIHTLDLLDYLSGGVSSLSAMDAKLRDTDDYEVEDTAMVLFQLKNGGQAVGFCTNCYPMSKQCTVELHLETATLVVKQSGLLIQTAEGEQWRPCETARGEKSEWGLSHGKLIDAFYRSILDDTPFICDCHTGLAAVQIVNAIQHSHGKRMLIDSRFAAVPDLNVSAN
ncbi:MAG: Gfo/Idh/MocA family oxidoreductase [Sphaerochaetaceae bacterium]|nr:Gfo/Idh/MocA family oxidoreductase [Sphaerochaetaceae bacterium]